jgi:peptidoglycan/LPS O-acetylase OafA/YrhL
MLVKFRRNTNGLALLSKVDGFRFLAIFPVVLMHVFTGLNKSSILGKDSIPKKLIEITGTGETGVDLFPQNRTVLN